MFSSWSFYGRRAELSQLQAILARRRWFFLQISGRRRIGKTTLIQEALSADQRARTLYLQIPDSDPVGVVAACNGYLETFGRPERVSDLGDLAKLVGHLAESGHIVAIDEFQYFHRKPLGDFCSLLQAEVDRLTARASEVTGGLIVLGSLHAEMTALLEDRDAPLFNRATDRLDLDHLDIASILEILRAHADTSPQRLLFLWNLFEGVPKFYRDAFEQGVLGAEHRELLHRLFFASSSPLRGEADNWFLRELRGRYDMVLQHLARNPGCTNAEIEAAIAQVSRGGEAKQIGGYSPAPFPLGQAPRRRRANAVTHVATSPHSTSLTSLPIRDGPLSAPSRTSKTLIRSRPCQRGASRKPDKLRRSLGADVSPAPLVEGREGQEWREDRK
ncbi:MAG: ATP-binding protein [Opitutaceae bacterium]|jgi:hypothetical protein|nr:ATP-binding protein [Opitutaceae bacterium]